MESGRNPCFKSVVKVQSLTINHNEKFTKPPQLAIGTHENLIELLWTVTSRLLWNIPPLPILLNGFDGLLLPHCHLLAKPHHGDGHDHGPILSSVVDIGDTWKHQVYHSKKYSVMLLKYFGSRNICWYSVTKSITEYFFHYITCFGDDKVRF